MIVIVFAPFLILIISYHAMRDMSNVFSKNIY
nr:MAG TPA: hypothetical protein [Caudoviricetes sp.]